MAAQQSDVRKSSQRLASVLKQQSGLKQASTTLDDSSQNLPPSRLIKFEAEETKHSTPPQNARQEKECLTNTKSSTDAKQQQSKFTQDVMNGQNMIKMFDQQSKGDNMFQDNNMAASQLHHYFQNESYLTPTQQKTSQSLHHPQFESNAQPQDQWKIQSDPTSLFSNCHDYAFNHNNDALGSKRPADISSHLLEQQIKQEDSARFNTPYSRGARLNLSYNTKKSQSAQLTNKKQGRAKRSLETPQIIRKQPSTAEKKKPEEEDSEEVEESETNRKMRGLKRLSLKVRDLVKQMGPTTYSNVANQLIKQLRSSKKGREEILGKCEDSSDEFESDQEKIPHNSANNNESEENSGGAEKWEKNVKRRVYDALNVLYAADVLKKKDTKQVYCADSETQNQFNLDQGANQDIDLQEDVNSYDEVKRKEIIKYQYMIQEQKFENIKKQELLAEYLKQYICYKHLLERNQIFEQTNQITDKTQKVQFPFMILASNDSSTNEIDLTYGEGLKSLTIEMRDKINILGDIQSLMKLGFYKVPLEWLQKILPKNIERIINVIPETHMREIIIPQSDQATSQE